MTSVREAVAVLEAAYPPDLASEWDAIGLTCGDPNEEITAVHFAVDCTPETVDEAIDLGTGLLVTHHPLLFSGVNSVATTDAKGEMVHRMIRAGIAHLAMHTNADHADPGVSDALAHALGLRVTGPLDAIDDGPCGTGRIGVLPESMTLSAFADVVAASLPTTRHGVRVAGDLDREVRTVAVCGGAGDSLLSSIGYRADVYVTADLRHHRAQEHLLDGGCALIDVAHWASEWPWLEQAAGVLRDGTTLNVSVSTTSTDPWSDHR